MSTDANVIPDEPIFICASSDLVERGRGVRFPVTAFGEDTTGFAVRHGGTAYGYLNRCAHVPIELDWNEGEFFDMSGLYLICSTHGAAYAPESGRCVAGPCRGGRLRSITLIEKDGKVFWRSDEYVRPVRA
jgi:nitrite reductase/ring-hydroxylating ferredoxin subunit